MNIKGTETMTLSVEADAVYHITYRSGDVVDILNSTEEDVSIEAKPAQDVFDSEGIVVGTTAITLPSGVARNNLELDFGALTITPAASGNVVIVRH